MTDERDEAGAAVRTRLFQFPGGVLELQSAGDDSEDYPGFYLEIHGHIAFDGHENQGAVMRWKPTCLGYLRTDVSGVAQLWDETQVRRLAERFGYDLAEVVVYDPNSGRPPLARLRAQATRLDAEAVIVPSPEHFAGGEIPGTLVQRLDVITVSPEETYARHAVPPLPDRWPARADGAGSLPCHSDAREFAGIGDAVGAPIQDNSMALPHNDGDAFRDRTPAPERNRFGYP
ncbi:hypothetical protein ACFROC_17575 [Nocardia tengchongensis]|uniref:hypothetical protein n=1 Tax=Nocardia tengchongensis TaxID=2055889 RepID=UPI0036AB099A